MGSGDNAAIVLWCRAPECRVCTAGWAGLGATAAGSNRRAAWSAQQETRGQVWQPRDTTSTDPPPTSAPRLTKQTSLLVYKPQSSFLGKDWAALRPGGHLDSFAPSFILSSFIRYSPGPFEHFTQKTKISSQCLTDIHFFGLRD